MTQTESYPVLPRMLRGLPPEVLAPPVPPMPVVEEPYRLRIVDPAGSDADIIAEWMQRPHLVTAWEQPWPVDRWRFHLTAQLATDYSRPIIASYRNVDIAYLELYRAAQDYIADKYDADPWDLGVHAAIADTKLVNRGLGPRLLPRLVASMLELDPKCQRVLFDPDYRNTGARRLCEFVGCEFLGEHDMSNRRMSLYALPRAKVLGDN